MLSFFSSLLVICASLQAQACEPRPSIKVSTQESLVDQDIRIQLSQLEPHEKIRIQAQTFDDNQVLWSSFGLFESDDAGKIDLSDQMPLEGSYQGADPMGLFWSMQPPATEIDASFKMKRDSFSVKITAYRGQEEICSRDIVRQRKASDVKRIAVRDNGLNAILFMPPSNVDLPVIITLSGSNGGYSENRAQLLASHGFAVLALAYFGVEGLPSNLQEIPLEYFETAFAWLKKQPGIDGAHIGVYGVSRGAELALILGSWFPESVQAIAAVVPSSVVYGGLSETPVDAWLYYGEPICPFAFKPRIDFSGELGKDREHMASTVQSFLEGMKEEKAFEEAAIPVERIRASLLLISGGDDQMWPSSLYAEKILQRLRDKQASIACEHLHYPKAGHGINIPHLPQPGPAYYHPVGNIWLSMGGTPAEDQNASADSWKKIIDFFHSSLTSEDL